MVYEKRKPKGQTNFLCENLNSTVIINPKIIGKTTKHVYMANIDFVLGQRALEFNGETVYKFCCTMSELLRSIAEKQDKTTSHFQ